LALPKIANALGVNFERILDLQPDLVVAWLSGNGHRVIDRLEHLGIRVFVTEPRRFADVERLLSVFGQISGHPREGSSQALRFRQQVASLRDRYAWKSSMSVFYQLSQRPLMTINGEHMISELLTLCGGDNVFADYRLLAPTVSIEDVMKRDADVILISSTVPNVNQIRAQWLMMNDLKAAKTERVFVVDADLVNRQTPRLVQGAEQVCQLIDRARSG
jgi:iron complex transport system substrate-binding protein